MGPWTGLQYQTCIPSWGVGRPTLNLNLNLNQKAVGYPYNICATVSYSLLTLWKCTFSFLFIFVFIYTIILSHFFHISTWSWFTPRPRLVNSQFKPREAVRTSAAQGGDFADRQTDRLGFICWVAWAGCRAHFFTYFQGPFSSSSL